MQKQVGDIRTFSFDLGTIYTIREILDNPKISMWWKWNSGICPHCKKKIERNIKHEFSRIEILGKISDYTIEDIEKGKITAKDLAGKEIKDENLTKDDIVLYGQTLDNRLLIMTADKYEEVFGKSKKFGRLAEKNNV